MDAQYRWVATYEDGQQLIETKPSPLCVLDHDGDHGFGCLDLSRLHSLQWEDTPAWTVRTFVRFDHDDMRPILFRRHVHRHVLAPVADQEHDIIRVLGWQRTVKGENVQALIAIMPDDTIFATDDQKNLTWP